MCSIYIKNIDLNTVLLIEGDVGVSYINANNAFLCDM